VLPMFTVNFVTDGPGCTGSFQTAVHPIVPYIPVRESATRRSQLAR
jgi:hypothetical protein